MEDRHPELDPDAGGPRSVNGYASPISLNSHAHGESRDILQAAVDGVPVEESTRSSDELDKPAGERADVPADLDSGAAGMPSVNGHPSPVPRPRLAPDESHDLPHERAAVDGGSVGGSSAPPDEPGEPADAASGPSDHLGDSLAETDWETTRYLAAATQLDLSYARCVVRKIVGQPFRAVAPAAGADIVVVTRWALAALRRRAQRDVILTCLLVVGLAVAVATWAWISVAVMAALAVFVVACERWVRDIKVLARQMLRGRFRPYAAPGSRSRRIENRLAVVQQHQDGNLIVFRGRSPFVGSGEEVDYNHILVNVARGKKKNGRRQPPVPFSIPQLHDALEAALKSMDLPNMRVGQRLYVNGEHVVSDSRLLPRKFGPPATDASSDLLREGCDPASAARTYVCAEIGGWEGQLVVSLFTRAVQSHGSLRVEWTFHVLPPLHSNFHLVDRRYELPVIAQIPKAMATGVLWFAPALVSAPVNLVRYAAGPLIEKAHTLGQSYRIRRGYVFNYGSPRSIREAPISYRRPHAFVVGDEWTFIMLAQHTLLRALEKFFKAHKIDMKQFAAQVKTINKVNKYNVGKIKAQNVAVGNKSHAGGDKKKS